jgi:hypothetical protein
MTREQKRWKDWADTLRQEMMAGLVGEVSKTVDDISKETGTEKSDSTLHSQKFWNACIRGEGSNATLCRAGFELSYVATDAGKVEVVTLRLDASWQAILQRVLDRKKLVAS